MPYSEPAEKRYTVLLAVLVVVSGVAGMAFVEPAAASGEPTIYRPLYESSDVGIGHTNATQRVDDIHLGVGEDGGNATYTLNVSSLAAAGVDTSNGTATVVNTRNGVADANASFNSTTNNVTVYVVDETNDSDYDDGDIVEFDLRVSGLDTTGVSPMTGIAYGQALDAGSNGTNEASLSPSTSENYGSAQNTTVFRSAVDGNVGPATLMTSEEAVVQTVSLNATSVDPLSPGMLSIRNDGTLGSEGVDRIEITYGDRWTETVQDTAGFDTADGVTIDISDRNTLVTGPIEVNVTVILTTDARNLTDGATIKPETTVTVNKTDGVANNRFVRLDGVETTVSVPLRNATFANTEEGVGAASAYNGSFDVADLSGSYETLEVRHGASTGPRGEWAALGGSFENLTLENVSVTVDGTDVVNRSESLTDGGDSLAIPLDGTAIDTGDSVAVNLTGVRNPDTTGEFVVDYILNPSGDGARVAAADPIAVTTGYGSGRNATVRSALAYDDGGPTIELVVDRSLEPTAVSPANVSVVVDGSTAPVTDARLVGNDRRVVLHVDTSAAPDEIDEVTAWGTTYGDGTSETSLRRAERTVVSGGVNATGYTSQRVALVAAERNATIALEGPGPETTTTGTDSRVALVTPSSAGTIGVDWNDDGLDYTAADLAYTAAARTITLEQPAQDEDFGPNVTVRWTVDAPSDHTVRVLLDPDYNYRNPVATETANGSGETTFRSVSVGRRNVAVELRDPESGVVTRDEALFQVDRLEERWRTDASSATSLAVENGRIFTVGYSSDNVTAYDAADGTQLWRRNVSLTTGEQGTAIEADGDDVYALRRNETIVALDAATGTTQWKANLSGDDPTTLAADGEHVYVGLTTFDGPGGVVALNSTDGAEVWRNTTFDDVYGMAVANDTLVTVAYGSVRAHHATNGTERWTRSMDSARRVAIRNGTAYVVADSPPEVASFDLGNGTRLSTGTVRNYYLIGASFARGPTLVSRTNFESAAVGFAPTAGDIYWEYYGLWVNDVAAVGNTVYALGEDNETMRLAAVKAPLPAGANVTGAVDGYPGETLEFNGTDSYGQVDSYEWQLEGEGTTTGSNATASFEPEGVYNVSLTVTSPTGFTDTATRRVVVSLREATSVPDRVAVGESATLDASALSGVANVSWRLDGRTVDSPTAEYAPTASGISEATLVADGDGWRGETTFTLRATRGDRVWSNTDAGSHVVAGDGRLVTAASSTVTERNPETGAAVWNYTTNADGGIIDPGSVAGIAVTDDVTVVTYEKYDDATGLQLVVAGVNGSGTEVWRRVLATGPDVRERGERAIAANDSHVFVEIADSEVAALNATATTTPPTPTETATPTPSTPGPTPPRLYTSTSTPTAEGGDGNGATVWRVGGPSGDITDIAVENGTVYALAVGSDANVTALDVSDGSVRWTKTVSTPWESGDDLFILPDLSLAATSGTVVVETGVDLTALAADSGAVSWRATLPNATTETVDGYDIRTVDVVPRIQDLSAADGRVTVAAETGVPMNYNRRFNERDFTRAVTFTADGERLWTNVSRGQRDAIGRADGYVYLGGESLAALEGPPALRVEGPRTVSTDESFTLNVAAPSEGSALENPSFAWSLPNGSASGNSVTTSIDDSGTYTIEVTATDEKGHSASTAVDVTVSPDTEGSGGGDGSTGGSSSGGAPTDGDGVVPPASGGGTATANDTSRDGAVTVSLDDVEPDSAGVTVRMNGTIVSEITFRNETAAKDAAEDGAEITVRDGASPPADAESPRGQSIVSVGIEVPDTVADTQAALQLAIPRGWVAEIGVDASNLTVTRYDEDAGEWKSLDTTVVSVREEIITVRAEASGISVFAVTVPADERMSVGETVTPTEVDGEPTAQPTANEATPASDTETKTASDGAGFGVLVALVGLLISVLRRRR